MPEEMTPSGEGERAPRDHGRDLRMIVTGVAAVLLVWFALVNLQDVKIHFWVHTERSPLIVVVLIAAILGALFGHLLTRRSKRSSRSKSS
jgi:uncharacterized integral membrane protein